MKKTSMIRGTPAQCMSSLPSFLAFKLGQYIEERFNEHFAELPLKARHFCVLRVLDEAHEPLSQQKLCEALWIDRATMTGVIHALTKLKFVSRADSDTDKRRVLVSLTESGKKFYRENWEAFTELEHHIFDSLSKSDVPRLKDLLKRVLCGIASR